MGDILRQEFDSHDNRLCGHCEQPIREADLYIEVLQHRETVCTTKLAVHVGCLPALSASVQRVAAEA